jgi:hypothetical protein
LSANLPTERKTIHAAQYHSLKPAQWTPIIAAQCETVYAAKPTTVKRAQCPAIISAQQAAIKSTDCESQLTTDRETQQLSHKTAFDVSIRPALVSTQSMSVISALHSAVRYSHQRADSWSLSVS